MNDFPKRPLYPMTSEPEEKSRLLHIGWSPMTIFSVRFVYYSVLLYRQLIGGYKEKEKVQFSSIVPKSVLFRLNGAVGVAVLLPHFATPQKANDQ